MTSILDRVVRLLTSWKNQQQNHTNHQDQSEPLTNAFQHLNRESSLSSNLCENELINLNSYPNLNQSQSQPIESNNYYYAISANQEPEMNTHNSNDTNNSIRLGNTLNNLRISFSLPHRRRSIRSSNRRSTTRQQQQQQVPVASLTSRGSSSTTGSSLSSNSSSSATSYNLFSVLNKRERNFLSAICAVFCIIVLSISLIEPKWFFLNGGGCNLNYVGVTHFFAPGRLEYQIETNYVSKKDIIVYNFILPNGLVLKNCANREIIIIMRTVIAFIFLAIFSSCIGLFLDTFGFMKSGIKIVRRHAIFHILTVIFCLAINGFCYWISERIYDQQNDTRFKKGKKVDVSFDISYYLIVLASGLSILATAFALIRRYPADDEDQLERLLGEYTGFEEPLHLERSLPANSVNTIQADCSLLNTRFVDSNNNNQEECSNNRNLNQRSPPPPPSTPPPSLRSSSIYQPIVITEPPPPYDPIAAIA